VEDVTGLAVEWTRGALATSFKQSVEGWMALWRKKSWPTPAGWTSALQIVLKRLRLLAEIGCPDRVPLPVDASRAREEPGPEPSVKDEGSVGGDASEPVPVPLPLVSPPGKRRRDRVPTPPATPGTPVIKVVGRPRGKDKKGHAPAALPDLATVGAGEEVVVDVTSKSASKFRQLSPFVHVRDIVPPLPSLKAVGTSKSVEGLWQGLKVTLCCVPAHGVWAVCMRTLGV
jgi:hypothetical protein